MSQIKKMLKLREIAPCRSSTISTSNRGVSVGSLIITTFPESNPPGNGKHGVSNEDCVILWFPGL